MTHAGRTIIDLDAEPFVPEGLYVVKHQKGGQFEWDPAKVKLYVSSRLSKRQEDGWSVSGHEFFRELMELVDMPIFNANLMDYLLKYPEFIPEDWKGRSVHFWGTIYDDSEHDNIIRYLHWFDGRWISCCGGFDYGWRDSSPAAVRVRG